LFLFFLACVLLLAVGILSLFGYYEFFVNQTAQLTFVEGLVFEMSYHAQSLARLIYRK